MHGKITGVDCKPFPPSVPDSPKLEVKDDNGAPPPLVLYTADDNSKYGESNDEDNIEADEVDGNNTEILEEVLVEDCMHTMRIRPYVLQCQFHKWQVQLPWKRCSDAYVSPEGRLWSKFWH